MRRYTSLLLTAFTLVLVIAAGTTYLAGSADQEKNKTVKTLTVYTTLPTEHVALLAAEYEKTNKVRVNFVPLSAEELQEKMAKDAQQTGDADRGDLVLADEASLQQAAAKGSLSAYVSEHNDAVAENFKDPRGFWTGVWYDPLVFCANRDYLHTIPRIPETWSDLAGFNGIRIGITDFLAADASAEILFALIGQYGEPTAYDLLRALHPKVVQYAKYLSTPVRMAGMGEVDISVAVQSETLRYINDGYPLKIIYPTDGTAYLLTGAALLKNPKDEAGAKDFLNWLLGDDVQLVLQKNGFFFVPVNPATQAYKTFAGKNIVLFDHKKTFSSAEKHAFLDRWVKNIRLE